MNPRHIAVVKYGHPKLNDFNVAEFMTWCGINGRFRGPWWRAQEALLLL
jgi:hypothetical protein